MYSGFIVLDHEWSSRPQATGSEACTDDRCIDALTVESKRRRNWRSGESRVAFAEYGVCRN